MVGDECMLKGSKRDVMKRAKTTVKEERMWPREAYIHLSELLLQHLKHW